LTSVRRFFASRRRSLAPRDGFVGRRDGDGGRSASETRAARRARAASRLRSCARCSDAVIVSTPSTRRLLRRSRSRSRWSEERTPERATSHTSSARESAVFTPCPPGPDDRENRHDSSDSGIVSRESTRSPGRWAAGMGPSSSSGRDTSSKSHSPRRCWRCGRRGGTERCPRSPSRSRPWSITQSTTRTSRSHPTTRRRPEQSSRAP
jgi:hypothetical protein